uniref:Putative secreted protein n=1 Tax=Anopheles darlingi TaxID=43151 RepID=A0A2M4D909_ANODA
MVGRPCGTLAASLLVPDVSFCTTSPSSLSFCCCCSSGSNEPCLPPLDASVSTDECCDSSSSEIGPNSSISRNLLLLDATAQLLLFPPIALPSLWRFFDFFDRLLVEDDLSYSSFERSRRFSFLLLCFLRL